MIQAILKAALAAGASDIHIHAGRAPMFRIDTAVVPCEGEIVTATNTAAFAAEMMTDRRWADFQTRRDADFSYYLPEGGRFRVNAHFQRGTVALSIRVIHPDVRPLETLFLPSVVDELTRLPSGLVLVTGGTGSGKSTTLAAMVDAINHRERGHIITLEDPIEYVMVGDKCCIEQREVGADVPDFASGLRHVLRQDPDVIMVGEMRDLETTQAAITAAETGHLVFSTLHTVNAAQTVDRIIDIHPTNQQNQIRSMLSATLAAVISQTLIPRRDRPGLIPAVEVLVCTPAVRACIREGRTHEIPTAIETGRAFGMISMDASLRKLVTNGYISKEVAATHAHAPARFAA